MIIREIQRKDLPKLTWTEKNKYPGKNKKDFDSLKTNQDFWYIADIDEEIVGRVRARTKGPTRKPYLFALRVQPNYQNKGVGTELIRKVEEKFRQLGFSCITLSVGKDNKEALKLYQKLGYKITGERIERSGYTYKGIKHSVTEACLNLEKTI